MTSQGGTNRSQKKESRKDSARANFAEPVDERCSQTPAQTASFPSPTAPALPVPPAVTPAARERPGQGGTATARGAGDTPSLRPAAPCGRCQLTPGCPAACRAPPAAPRPRRDPRPAPAAPARPARAAGSTGGSARRPAPGRRYSRGPSPAAPSGPV